MDRNLLLETGGSRISERIQSMAKTLGIVLIVLGVLAFLLQGISYTTREKVVDLGPVEVTKEQERTIPLPPLLGGIALAGGIALVAVGGKRR
jgi:hypothetical protein